MRLVSIFLRLSILCLFVLFITSCGSISGIGTDNTPKPTRLKCFHMTYCLHPKWKIQAGGGAHGQYLKLTPAVTSCGVFAVDAWGNLYAFNKNTGHMYWHTKVCWPSTGITADSNKLYIGGASARLMAVAQQDGLTRWSANTPNQLLAAPAVIDNQVLIKTIDGQLCAFNTMCGQKYWCYEHGGPVFMLRGDSSPQIAHGRVVAGFADGKLASYSLDQGQLLWEQTIA